MPQAVTIKSIAGAFRMMKVMQAQGIEWGEDYRVAARASLVELIEGRMAAAIDLHLERMAALGVADRRRDLEGTKPARLGLGHIELLPSGESPVTGAVPGRHAEPLGGMLTSSPEMG